MRYITKKRIYCFALLIILMAIFYIIINALVPSKPLICDQGHKLRQHLKNLLIRTTDSLDSLRLSYFLCYASLWGALKLKSMLPWMTHIDLCLLNEEVSERDEGYIYRVFKKNSIILSYQLGDGVFIASDDNKVQIKLILFEKDAITGQCRRIGWKNRIIPPISCDLIHCFPPHLIEKPLPTAEFMGLNLPVPRDEIEIQKYLFPDSWWKELTPSGCQNMA